MNKKLRLTALSCAVIMGLTGCFIDDDSSIFNNDHDDITEIDTESHDDLKAGDLEALSIYRNMASVGETYEMGVNNKDSLNSLPESLTWRFIEVPEGVSFPALIEKNNGHDVSFIPEQEGIYKLEVTDGIDTRIEKVLVYYEVPYEEAKTKHVTEDSFYVTNQYLYLTSYSENELLSLLEKYSNLDLRYFEKVKDKPSIVYIEVLDETSAETKEQLTALKLEENISLIGQRFIERDLKTTSDYYPQGQSSNDYNDAGENWHLEFMKAPKFWDISQGSKDVTVGIYDGGINGNHEELKGRVNIIGNNKDKNRLSHGTATTGIIIANDTNNKGIVGINHLSHVEFISYDFMKDKDDAITTLYQQQGTKVINASIGPVWYKFLTYKDNIEALDPLGTLGLKDLIEGDGSLRYLMGQLNFSKNTLTESEVLEVIRHAASGYSQSFYTGVYKSYSLLVLAASNDATNAKYANGSVHLDSEGNFRKSNDIIVVGAHRNNIQGNKVEIADYSNYGKTVDIYAPTEVKAPNGKKNKYYTAPKSNYGHSGGFDGTSAAAPMVSGVASIIYSINPSFTAKEVKEIIISTADTMNGYRVPSSTEFKLVEDESLNNDLKDIKVLNAYAAIDKAKSKVEELKLSKTIKINPIKKVASLELTSAIGQVTSFNGTIESGTETCKPKVNYTKTFLSKTDTTTLDLNENSQCYTIKGKASVRKGSVLNGKSYTVDYDTELYLSAVTVTAIDQGTFKPLNNVSIFGQFDKSLKRCNSDSCKVKTDANGKITLLLPANNAYQLNAKATGYKDASLPINLVSTSDNISFELPMSKIEKTEVGALHGFVTNSMGERIEGASLRISGGEQTNGYFASAESNKSGHYMLTNIVKNDSDGNKIPEFTISVSATGYKTMTLNKAVIIDGKVAKQDFILYKDDEEDIANQIITDFEDGINNWELTGFWNIASFGKHTKVNSLFTNGFVSLPLNEKTDKSYLPTAHSKKSMLWFGQSSTGSFIGEQVANQPKLSGGTSTQSYSGTVTSPPISLKGKVNPTLKFWTWWEIEGVNPNEKGYDLMDVRIAPFNKPDYETVVRLNPKIDPNDDNRASKPMTSGGYNKRPIWVEQTVDLSEYAGQIVRVQFSFDTKDEQYNGFRGWFIDDLSIDEGAN